VPAFGWVQGYERGWLRGDLIAGLTVWAVLVPEALTARGAGIYVQGSPADLEQKLDKVWGE